MIKNIYDKVNNYYKHEYYCDNCFIYIGSGEIFRSELAIDENKFDLCCDCKKHWDEKLEKLREV